MGNCLTIVTNSQGEEKSLFTSIIYDKEEGYPSFLEKNILPQRGKDVPRLETSAGKEFQGFFEGKMNSTFSTNVKSGVTQLGIV